MAYEGFDWKGYLAYAGYPENEIPENVTDEELAQIRDHWARTVYQEELAIAAQDPFLETKKEREEAARDKLLALAPEYRQAFGLKEAQPAEAAFSADEFREHVVNNPVQDAPLDYYLKTFAAKRIGKNTKYEYHYLEGLTKKDFQDLFMERNGIDPDLTTVEHIRNGEFGPAWMAQRAEEESNLPKGSAMRQGWLTFKKLTGLTTETFGDALGIEWMRNIGKGITENAIKTIEEEGYRSKYGESLVDTFKAQGPFAAAGKVLEMAQENWATTGVPLALAGMSALFGIAARNPRLAAQGLAGARASLAAATSADVAMGTGAAATVGRVGASTIAKSLAFASALASGLEVGATREELEEQSKKTGKQLYDPSDPSDVVAWGLLSAALDHVGNMMTFVGGGGLVRAAKGLVQSQQTRMIGAAEAAIRQAGREAGKSWGRKVVEAMGTEGITEALQEYANIMPARNKGVEYTPKEIRDRMIDAGAVGAFMGGGMRGVQALTERKPRTQSESDTTTPQQPTQTQTPPPNVPSAPNQPPPPGFNVASNTNYAEIEGGYAAWDGYNTGYGNTKEEASQAIIDQSNKNKDTIDPANVTSTANESRVSFGNGGEIVVTGNGHKKVIGDIISLHNANDNVVNLDGTKTHNFDATTLSGLSAEALRNRIEHSGKTAIPDTRSVRKARADQVDIAINYRGEKRDSNGNLIGYRAELVLDDATRNQLAAKGYRILGSQFNNDVQTVQLYRDGQIYRIELTTNGNEVSSTLFTKKILGNLDARVESELSTQKHRITDVGGAAKEVQNFFSVSPAVRSGGIQIERTGVGADAKFVNRKALENFVKKQGGKVVKSTDRSITYELGGETLRLDLQANGDVVVSRNGRFLGAYQFDGSDLGNGMERATYDLTNDVAPVTRFSAQDVYEGLGYRRASNRSQNVLFVKDNESGDYYVIKVSNKGKVDAVVVPYDPNGFFARLEALDSMSTIEDVRQVYQDQFRSGYVEFVDFGGGNLGMRSRTTGLMTDDINDVQMLTSDEVDDIINNPTNPNYNPRLMENLVKVVGISQYTSSTSTTPARIVDWVTVDDVAGVRAFIERAKGYGAIIADYDSTGNNISVKGKAWNAPGSFNADAAGLGLTDLYEEDYLNFDPDVHIDNLAAQGTATARAEIEEDIKKVAKATRKAFKDMRDLLSRSSTYLPSVTNADIGIIESAYRSTFNRRPRDLATTAQKAKNIRRHFYRARLLQARLHIDVLMANPEFYANRVIEAELRRLQAYDSNWTNDEVRFAAAEAEEIALRLEEEFLNLREMQVSTSISRQIWDTIYPGNGGVEYGSFIERIHNQGNDFRFSRDVNAPRAERHMSLLDELRNHPFIGNGALSDLIDSGKLVLLETQQEIEDALLREGQTVPKFDQLGNIQGFASNDNMRVYLSSWGIKQGDAFRVLLHEMGAHTRRFGFSEAEFQEILSGIKANSTAQTPEGRHIRHAMWRAQNAKVSPNDPHYWEEVAAYLVEGSNEYAGLGMLDTMQAWVKRWLFTNGYIDATNFHYQDFTIFSLGMLRDSRIPLRLLNGKFDYSRHQNRIYDTRKFVESYVTEDIAKELGYSREEVIEMVAAHLAGTYKAGNHVIGDLPDEDELMSYFPTVDEDARREGLRYSLVDINAAERLDIFNDVTTRLSELSLAQHMEDVGATEEEIKFATNWTRGNDGIWKYEISDKWMKFDIPVLRGRREEYKKLKSNITETRKMIKSRDGYEQYLDAKEKLIKFYIGLTRGIANTDGIGGIYTTIDNIITHKELFIAYPDLRLNRFEFVDDVRDEDSYGWIENDGTLKVNVGSIIRDVTSVKEIEETIKNTVIHEVQHLIQRISGFARGGSPEMFETLEQKRREKQVIEGIKYARKSLEEFRNIFFSDDNVSLFLKDNPQLSEKEIEELRKTIEDKFPRSSYPIHLRDEVGDLFYNYLKNDNPKIDELWESITKSLNNFKMLNRVYSDNSVSKYRKLLGEIEARVVENRRKLSEEQLRSIPISTTQIEEGIYSKEDMIDPDSLLPLAYKEGRANLGFAIRRNFSESKVEADWRAFDRDDSASDLRFSRDMETAIAEARDEVLRPHLPPAGVQKDASVIYPNMGEEISNFRYSIGKKAREEYRAQLERGRENLSPDKIENILKELDKYHDAKQFKKVKAALHWTITGKIILPEDEYKVNNAIKLAENKGIDLISNLKKYESPLDFINEYLESRPEGAPIRLEQLGDFKNKEGEPIFTDEKSHGNGIVSYQVDDSKEGQQAMREIINTHLGKDQSPWCLLYADAQGRLQDRAWYWWSENYTGLPKRVAFKNGNLISFMATNELPLVVDEAITTQVEHVLEYPGQYSRGVSDYIDGLKNISRDRLLLLKLKSHIINKNTLPISDFKLNYGVYGSLFDFLPEEKTSELRKEIEEAIKNRTRYLDLSLSEARTVWDTAINKFISYLDNVKIEYTYKAREFLLENKEDLYKIKKQNDGVIIVDILGKGLNFEGAIPIVENEIFSPTIFYFDKKYGNYIIHQPSEKWWDINDNSHPDLEWAKVDPEVGRIRFSIAGEIGEQEIILPEGTIRFSVADVARLTYDFGNYKDISLKQFTDRFQKYITNRDNTMEDVERICADYIKNVHSKPADFVPQLDPRKRNYLRYFFIENGESRGQLYDEGNAKHNNDATDQQIRIIALYRESLSEKDFNRLYELLSIPRNEQTKEQKDEISALDSRARFGDLTKEEIDRFSELFIAGRDGESDFTEDLPLEDQQFLADFFDSTMEEDQKRREEDKEFSKLKSRISNFGNGILDEIKIINEERNKAIESLAQYFNGNSDYHSTEKALILWGAMRYAITERMVNNDELEVKLWKLSDDNDARVMVVPGEWTAKIVDHLRRGASYEDALVKASKEMKEINAAKRGVPPGFTGWKVYEQNDSYEAGQELQQAVAGTGWCTGAAVSTAQIHRTGGDFHVYFENGEPTIAIRTENGRMAEPPRGAHKGQFCTPEEEAIAEEYIRTGGKIAAGDDYLQDREDIRRLASGEMTWQEAFLMPDERRYENGEFGGDTKAWPEGVKKARKDILEKYKEERLAAGWFYNSELDESDNEKVIYLFTRGSAIINSTFVNVTNIIGDAYIYEKSFLPNLTNIRGSVFIYDGKAVPKLTTIEGNIHIDKEVTIPKLTTVTGYTTIENKASVPELISIGGYADIREGANAPKLTTIGEHAKIYKNTNIPELTTIKGNLDIVKMSGKNVEFQKLMYIGGNLLIYEGADFPNLTVIGGAANINSNAKFPKLTTINGTAYINEGANAPELTTIRGSATISPRANVPKLKSVSGDLEFNTRMGVVTDASSLTSVGGRAIISSYGYFPNLISIGGDAAILDYVDASALTTVGGDFAVHNTANISSLTTVGGNIELYDGKVATPIKNIEELRREMGVRFSIAQQPTTPEQGTAIPNAPGMYKMRNGTIQAHPEYIPPGLETETAIYAAVAISDIAKNEPGLEDVRAMINADEVLREEVLAELSQRGIEDTRDNEFLYAIRNVLQTREPEDPTYQAIVDVFHDAITKATGGIQDDILLTDSDIAAAAHAIINTPFEPLIGDPVPTVPTPKPTVFDQMEANWAMMQSTIDEAVANAEVSERETPIIRYSIAGVDMRLDGVEGYNGVDGRQKLYAELEQIYGSTHQWNEWDSFYNQLAAAQITGTREVHDVGALAAPADSNRGLVDQFLNAALPDYLKDKIQIEWTMTPDAVKNLNGGLASFDPRGGAADKLIYIQGWSRTVGQVIRSAAWELSRFGWNAAPGAMINLKKPLVELYNLHESAIYQELSPYYTKYKINRANVSDKHKIFLVQTYFAKMNQDILTGNPNALAQQIGIDPATYKRIHDEIVQNVNTATTDLTNYIENYTAIATDPEIAKAFTQDILRLIMGGMHGRGAAFVYETANSAGPSDTIYCYTNDFGLHRKFVAPTDEDNRYARIANEIKQNLKWWRETFEPWGLGELAENFCRFFLRNFPMHNGLSFLHLNVPSAHLGDTTITKATSLISRIWQRVDDPHGIEIREKLKVMERIHAILRDHNYDARWTENATNGYEALFRSLGITDEKSIATAQLADRALPDLQAMIQRNAAEIRADFAMTIDSLVTHMSTSRSIPEREITNMIQRMNNYAESFLGDYEHRTYEAYSLDGLDELIAMKHDLNIDPNTGELTIHAKAAAAQKFISDTEQRLGGRNAEFYKQTEEARNIVRRASRLDSLRKYKQAKITNSHRGLTGGELDERVIKEMNDELGKLIDDVREMRTADRGIYKKFNYIPGAKRRKLDERIEADREYMNFLGRVTDPLMNAIYSIDQQKKILEKLHFNRELGEHIISSGMGEIRGDAVSSSVGEGTIKDISTLEGGTFLEYIRVYPEFQKEINAEYRINSKVRDSVLGGVIDVWKANNTIYSLRLGINNYVGNFSMLLASGHLWRFANIFQAGQITKRQFLERFTTNVNGLDATTQELYEEMRSARVVGGTMSEMNVMAYGRGVHEKVIGFFLKHLRDADVLSSQGKFVAETWVNSFLEKMKTFYAFGDEWVKPLMYLNNRANAIAKWESKLDPNAPEFGGDVTEWRKEVRRRAIEEAAEQTIRESVSWENSPQFIRWLSQKNLRIFTPDFLMHNFQMLRITASNFLRLGECFRELNSLDVNNERDANYKDALVKEIAQRGVGGAMTTAVYAGLMGATGSVMALVPYMVNVLFNNIEGEGDDDDKKGMFFGPDEWEGAQRLINYKTGGNNLFVPVFKSGDKIYAWNYVRSSVMLTHAPVRPPTDDPTFTDYGAVIMRNIVDLSNGTMTQQLINNMMGKDRFGREIGIVEGWGRVLERTLVPGFARQLAGVTLGYPLSDNMFHEGRAIKIPDLLGITVNAYDPRDVANHLAYDINSHNTDRNIHRRNFVEQLSKSDRLSDRQIVGMIADMRERNARDLSKANYVVTGLRQVGMTDQEIVHWLTHNRKTGGDALARKHAVGLLKGKDIYDEALITTLVNKRNRLNEGPQNLRMSKDELAVVNANLDKAIRMYKQALRVQ